VPSPQGAFARRSAEASRRNSEAVQQRCHHDGERYNKSSHLGRGPDKIGGEVLKAYRPRCSQGRKATRFPGRLSTRFSSWLTQVLVVPTSRFVSLPGCRSDGEAIGKIIETRSLPTSRRLTVLQYFISTTARAKVSRYALKTANSGYLTGAWSTWRRTRLSLSATAARWTVSK